MAGPCWVDIVTIAIISWLAASFLNYRYMYSVPVFRTTLVPRKFTIWITKNNSPFNSNAVQCDPR